MQTCSDFFSDHRDISYYPFLKWRWSLSVKYQNSTKKRHLHVNSVDHFHPTHTNTFFLHFLNPVQTNNLSVGFPNCLYVSWPLLFLTNVMKLSFSFSFQLRNVSNHKNNVFLRGFNIELSRKISFPNNSRSPSSLANKQMRKMINLLWPGGWFPSSFFGGWNSNETIQRRNLRIKIRWNYLR